MNFVLGTMLHYARTSRAHNPARGFLVVSSFRLLPGEVCPRGITLCFDFGLEAMEAVSPAVRRAFGDVGLARDA